MWENTSWSRRVFLIVVSVVVAIGVLYLINHKKEAPVTPVPLAHNLEPEHLTIGKSVQGRDIDVYKYGSGSKMILFVGGIHGGYEWNSVLLAYQFIDYLVNNKEIIPENLTVAIIPNLNPDGVYKVTKKEGRFTTEDVSKVESVLASGRFNAHDIDLNRNFDCNWTPKSNWRSKVVSAGTKAFSEPEAMTLRKFVEENNPNAVVFWHSQANAVYASECNNGILPETLDLMSAYSTASGYPAVKSFDSYKVTGDAEGWLASVGIPAITVELSTHETIEWYKNLAGIKSVLNYFKVPSTQE